MRPVIAPPAPPGLMPGPVPTFSIVIPAYQAADVIGEAVASALKQTVPPYEVIVCDDGSTDAIDVALAPYRARITLLHKENGGGASALNTATAAASGEYISWLDADDSYEPERLEATGLVAAQRPDLDILMTESYLEADGRVVGRFSAETPFAPEEQRLAILDRCFIGWPAIKRSLVLEIGGFDESLRIAYDWDFWIRALFAGARAGLINVPLHRYRINDESLSGARASALRERVVVIEWAARTQDLTDKERRFVKQSLRSKRRRALLTEAEWAIRSGAAGARRKALAVTFGRGFGPRVRLKAALAALAPHRAAVLLDKRESRTGRSRLKRSVPIE